MSAFYVGQRIKKVRGLCVSCTASVLATAQENSLRPEATMIVRLETPAFGPGGRFVPGNCPYTDPTEWEPILPDGLESLDEINALYEPEPCTADVDSRGFDLAKAAERFRVLHWPDPWVGLPE